jgi:hypothetical protein
MEMTEGKQRINIYEQRMKYNGKYQERSNTQKQAAVVEQPLSKLNDETTKGGI